MASNGHYEGLVRVKSPVPLRKALILWMATAFGAMAQPAPRAGDGRADLTGVWSNASITQLQRPSNLTSLTISEDEAQRLAASSPSVRFADADAAPTDPTLGPPVAGGAVGAVNAFWSDPGDSYARVQGEYRTSWIVDPENGQLPLTEAGRERTAAAAATRFRNDPEGPEHLAPNDRCLIASRGTGGPGMLNNIYNSNYQIVQTPEAVVIVSEMVNDARIIPVFTDAKSARAAHGPAVLNRWLGDSVGWWSGDTLVVETVNVNRQQGEYGPIFLSPGGRVTERFTRVSATQIFYAFLVEDPVYYTRSWRAEMSLNALTGRLFEFACHEGNYALSGVLAGARLAERERAAN
jgi:hypothetical protein